MSKAAQVPIRTAGRGFGRPREVSSTASVPARKVVTMDREDAATIASFENGLAGVAEVRHAERLFGDPDYLIRVATTDLAAYQVLRDEKLGTLPGVQRLNSTIVMKRIVDDRPFQVSPPPGRLRSGGHRTPQRRAAPWHRWLREPASRRSW